MQLYNTVYLLPATSDKAKRVTQQFDLQRVHFYSLPTTQNHVVTHDIPARCITACRVLVKHLCSGLKEVAYRLAHAVL